MIVVDANILAFYIIEGERTTDANALRKLDAEWMVPSLWCVELQSILWKCVQFGGMPPATAHDLLEQAIRLYSANEVILRADAVLAEALRSKITVYDAEYIALARQLGVVCVTEDRALIKACPATVCTMKAFLSGRPGDQLVREPRAVYRVRRRGKARTHKAGEQRQPPKTRTSARR